LAAPLAATAAKNNPLIIFLFITIPYIFRIAGYPQSTDEDELQYKVDD